MVVTRRQIIGKEVRIPKGNDRRGSASKNESTGGLTRVPRNEILDMRMGGWGGVGNARVGGNDGKDNNVRVCEEPEE